MVIAAYSGRQRSFIRKQTVGVFYGKQKNNIFSSIFDLVPKIEREEAGERVGLFTTPCCDL